MSRLFFLFFICVFATKPLATVRAGEDSEQRLFLFLPENPSPTPLLANPQEPRIGLRKEIGTSRLRLDIGAAIDLLEYKPSSQHRFRLGVTMFTYVLTMGSDGLRLQVDAVDGFFGGYLSYLHEMANASLRIRLRIIHRSAHFVDGHIDPITGTWKDNRAPIAFTKDFGELLAGISLAISGTALQIYSGMSYTTLIRPEEIERFETLHGIEWHTNDSFTSVFQNPFNCYAAYHLAFTGIPEYIGTHSLETGIKFGRWSGRGVRFFFGYHNGLEVFGQYYNVRRAYWTIGFGIDAL